MNLLTTILAIGGGIIGLLGGIGAPIYYAVGLEKNDAVIENRIDNIDEFVSEQKAFNEKINDKLDAMNYTLGRISERMGIKEERALATSTKIR